MWLDILTGDVWEKNNYPSWNSLKKLRFYLQPSGKENIRKEDCNAGQQVKLVEKSQTHTIIWIKNYMTQRKVMDKFADDLLRDISDRWLAGETHKVSAFVGWWKVLMFRARICHRCHIKPGPLFHNVIWRRKIQKNMKLVNCEVMEENERYATSNVNHPIAAKSTSEYLQFMYYFVDFPLDQQLLEWSLDWFNDQGWRIRFARWNNCKSNILLLWDNYSLNLELAMGELGEPGLFMVQELIYRSGEWGVIKVMYICE